MCEGKGEWLVMERVQECRMERKPFRWMTVDRCRNLHVWVSDFAKSIVSWGRSRKLIFRAFESEHNPKKVGERKMSKLIGWNGIAWVASFLPKGTFCHSNLPKGPRDTDSKRWFYQNGKSTKDKAKAREQSQEIKWAPAPKLWKYINRDHPSLSLVKNKVLSITQRMKYVAITLVCALSLVSGTLVKRDAASCAAHCQNQYTALVNQCMQLSPEQQGACVNTRSLGYQQCANACVGQAPSPVSPPAATNCASTCAANYQALVNQCMQLTPGQQGSCVATRQVEYGSCVQRC
jgi:hypothetical protein